MRSRFAASAAVVAALCVIVLVGMIVQYTSPNWGLILLLAYAFAAIIAAAVGAGGAVPPWWAPGVLAVALVAAGLWLWPRETGSWNFVFAPLLTAAAAAAAITLVLARTWVRKELDLGTDPVIVAPGVLRPALLWASAVALGAIGLLVLFSLNPIGLGFLISAAALAIAAVAALLFSPRRPLALLIAVLATPIPLIAMHLLLVATGTVGPDRRYEIPADYRGWVIIQEESPRCPRLGVDGGTLVFTVNENGCGCTSDTTPGGWSNWSYVAVARDGTRTELPLTGWGGGGLIWAGFNGYAADRTSHSGFFVGTEDELQRSWLDQRPHESRCLRGP